MSRQLKSTNTLFTLLFAATILLLVVATTTTFAKKLRSPRAKGCPSLFQCGGTIRTNGPCKIFWDYPYAGPACNFTLEHDLGEDVPVEVKLTFVASGYKSLLFEENPNNPGAKPIGKGDFRVPLVARTEQNPLYFILHDVFKSPVYGTFFTIELNPVA